MPGYQYQNQPQASGMRTAGMAVVELMMLYAAIRAKDFKKKPTVRNMTAWADSVQVIDDPYTTQVEKYRRVKRTMGRKLAA